MRYLLFAAAVLLAAYTQFTHLHSVPGLHFDEGWQGVFALRIMSEPGFYPLTAMNSYTSPIVHYILAGIFSVFGATLAVMRGAYGIAHLATMVALAFWLKRFESLRAATWFVALWALLPLSVHDHRFYVEATGFHGACAALILWGLTVWKRQRTLAWVLIVPAVLAGAYSHILFVAVFAAALFTVAFCFPCEFRSKQAKRLTCFLALALLPMPIRMGIGLKKMSPFLLAAALATLAAIAALPFLGRLWDATPSLSRRVARFMEICCVPFLVAFVFLMWNGFWPYAQATGHLELIWFPINALIFLGAALKQLKNHARPDLLWTAFIALFFSTSLLILKQSPRYYMVPAIMGMLWCARELTRISAPRIQALLAVAFVGWNSWAFQTHYIQRFEAWGATGHEFKLAFFHDNARDFRPFQKIFEWARRSNCLAEKPWVEDDRFARPFDFMQHAATPAAPGVQCPWRKEDLFFSHIPNFDPAQNGQRNEMNAPPPKGAENVKFLAHFPEWGDLAVWIRR